MRDIWHISAHCSLSDHKHHDNIETLDKWHREKGWSEIGYHFVIVSNGDVHIGRSIEKTPAAVLNHNRGMIAICLTGHHHFTQAQFKSLRRLIHSLMLKYNIFKENVKGHNEYPGHTTRGCPIFDLKKVLWGVKSVHQTY